MQRLKQNRYFIFALANSKNRKQRLNLLRFATREQVLSLAEIVANFLKGNISIPNKTKIGKYRRRKRLFRVLGYMGRKSWLQRKQAAVDLGSSLIQFLNEILPVLL